MRKTSTNKAKGKKSRPKTKLGIPDLEHSKAAVLRSLGSPDSRRGYQHAIDEFVAWYCSEPRLAFNKTVVLRYRFHLEERGLAPGTINVRMAAVRRLAYEAADSGLLSPELAAGIHRVKGVRKLGSRLGNWLTAGEAAALWQIPDGRTLTGKRNRAILAILLGCGLRRRELAELTLESLQRREERWAIVDLVGKGSRERGRQACRHHQACISAHAEPRFCRSLTGTGNRRPHHSTPVGSSELGDYGPLPAYRHHQGVFNHQSSGPAPTPRTHRADAHCSAVLLSGPAHGPPQVGSGGCIPPLWRSLSTEPSGIDVR
jgi:integrase